MCKFLGNEELELEDFGAFCKKKKVVMVILSENVNGLYCHFSLCRK